MKRLVLLLALLPGTARAQDWWQGIWAWDAEWCAAAEQIGSVTPAPIAITATEVLGYENTCRITGSRQISESVVHMSLSCAAEGSLFPEDRLIMRGENAIWIWFGANEPIEFKTCN